MIISLRAIQFLSLAISSLTTFYSLYYIIKIKNGMLSFFAVSQFLWILHVFLFDLCFVLWCNNVIGLDKSIINNWSALLKLHVLITLSITSFYRVFYYNRVKLVVKGKLQNE